MRAGNPAAAVTEHPAAFSVKGFCRAHQVGRTFVYAEIRAGRLIARKAGKKTLITSGDAAAWRANLTPIEPKK